MKARCTNLNDQNYYNYGGRGILLCDRWFAFDNFFADMGHPPPGMTLERLDNNKGYNPDNCVWASREAQARNKRTNVWVELDGGPMILADALRRVGKSMSAERYRMKKFNLTYQEVFESWLLQKKAL
jgi:hypothetical protein